MFLIKPLSMSLLNLDKTYGQALPPFHHVNFKQGILPTAMSTYFLLEWMLRCHNLSTAHSGATPAPQWEQKQQCLELSTQAQSFCHTSRTSLIVGGDMIYLSHLCQFLFFRVYSSYTRLLHTNVCLTFLLSSHTLFFLFTENGCLITLSKRPIG